MRFLHTVFIKKRFFQIIIGIIVLFVFSYFLEILFPVTKILLFTLILITLFDYFLLYKVKNGVHGVRFTPEKLSNGDENPLRIYLENRYAFKADIEVIDEIPHQFQVRNISFSLQIQSRANKNIDYTLRPVKRGEYDFGAVNVFVSSPLGLAARRFKFSENKLVPVYPSYIQMRKYELMAISNQLTEYGIKKIRRIGHNMEFEQIKEYVQGDDVRTINWKATARKNQLMVNNFQDERSQQVYCLIDKGRMMQMPFRGMTLLDYAINASLVISNIAIKKDDKAGLITFQHKIGDVLPAGKRNNQMFRIQETLYKQKTAFKEPDFSRLYAFVKSAIRQRSLLLLFTNFESKVSLERQLRFISSLARSHVVVVIFFENTELDDLLNSEAKTVKEIYYKGIAEKFAYEKRLVVKELNMHGVHTILTKPEDLTVNTINKYLELKARGLI
ncbi:MAG: DUF58 domain-containing protein [Cyclobacteriaceae bacterium]|nr:DUF58 domain-containing protein [Cyclobacteriaceae bacterium]